MKLSILDQLHFGAHVPMAQAMQDTIILARHLESLGFARHWIVEHHAIPYELCADPMLMALALARETTRMRIGVGGILMNNYSPYKVAEQVKTLSMLAPDRIDIGLGQSCSGALIDLALQPDRDHKPAHDQAAKIDELLGHLYADLPEDHRFGSVKVLDQIAPPVPWIMAVTAGSGARAGALGLPLALSAFHRPEEAIATAAAYRKAFRPSGRAGLPEQPQMFIAIRLQAAETQSLAEARAMPFRYCFDQRRRLGLMPQEMPSPAEAARLAGGVWPAEEAAWPMVWISSYDALRDRLLPMAEAVGAEEIMLQDGLPDTALRLEHYTAVSDAITKG